MQNQALLKTVLDSLDLGVLILDQDLHLVYVNDWFQKRCQMPLQPNAAIGLSQIFPELQNSLLLECCHDALADLLPKFLANSVDPHPLPLYAPQHLGQKQHKIQQAIDIRPITIEANLYCQILIHDVTSNLQKEDWLKRIANNFRNQALQKDTSIQQFSHIIENTADGILVLNSNGELELANASANYLLGITESTNSTSLTLADLFSQSEAPHYEFLRQHLQAILDNLQPDQTPAALPAITSKLVDGQGRCIPVELRFSISQDQGQKKLITTIRDCSDQVETERNFRASENRFQTLAKLAPVGIFRTCPQGIVRYANETWFHLTGAVADDINRVQWLHFIEPRAREKIRPKWLGLKDKRFGLREEFKLKATQVQTDPTWVLCNLMAEFDSQEKISGYVGILTDISQQRLNQEAIQRLAYHDTLTGLPNRRYFSDTLEQHIRLNRRDQTAFALLAMDLNGFKQINDTLGHDAGDEVLTTVAQRLQSLLRESASIARLGGDEFAVMIPGFSEPRALEVIAQRIQDMVRQPIHLHNQEVSVSTSIGIALFPNDADSNEDLVKNADLALYAAKDNPQQPFVFFDKGMNQQAATNRSLLNDLDTAIGEEHFDLLLAATHRLGKQGVTAKAMLCWRHTTWGQLHQPDFIQVLQRSRLAKPFTLLMMERICQAIQTLSHRLTCGQPIPITVSLEPFQLLQAGFAEDISALFQRHQVLAKTLHIALPEAQVNDYFGSLLPVLLQLERAGFQLTISEFSGAYLALQKISKLPISQVRMCPTLLEHAQTHNQSQLQLASLCDLSQRLGLTTLCHSEASAQQLRQLGCSQIIIEHNHPAQPLELFIEQITAAQPQAMLPS